MNFNQNINYLATTLQGLENVLENEIQNLGGKNTKVLRRAVSFEGDKKLLYKTNLHLRTALKILKPFATFSAKDENELYDQIKKIDWADIFNVDNTFMIDSVVNSKYFKHSKYVALKSKDAIVDYFRKKTGERPSIDTTNPEFRINIHIYNDNITVSLDSSGESLHKRGYRIHQNIAPLNEVLAAGMILLSGWNGKSVLIDPMCGSATILIEAAMIANDIPPGIFRKKFAFEEWKDFDNEILNELLEEWENKKFENIIIGADISERAIINAKENIKNASLHKNIKTIIKSFEKFNPPNEQGVVIMNPPYGERMKKSDIESFYSMIGERLKHNYSGYDVWILSSNFGALKKIGLHPSKKMTLFNGPLECKFQKFSIYEGSLKKRKQANTIN